MKKLVFLHGAGADKSAYHTLMQHIARRLSVELVTFNAPFPHPLKPNRFVWFNKFEQDGQRDAVEEEYFYSLEFVRNRLKELNVDLQEILLFGHSQGGGLAAHVGLNLELKGVVSICGDLPYNIKYDNSSATPVYWLEGGKDSYITPQRKESYKMLQNIKARLYYKVLPTSTHNEFAQDLLDEIKKIRL